MARDGVTIRVEGLSESIEALKDLRDSLGVSNATARNTIKRALTFAGRPVEEAAASAVKVRTGRLKGTITTTSRLTKRQRSRHQPIAPIEVFVGAGNVPHAHMLEFGTAHSAPQPFLRPAVDSNVDDVSRRFVEQLRVETEKTAARARRKLARLLKGKD